MPDAAPTSHETPGPWNLWLLGLLLVLRLVIAPWGDVLIFNNTIDFSQALVCFNWLAAATAVAAWRERRRIAASGGT
jgi:hypothetical protein